MRDWARAFGVLLGLGVIAMFLWFAFLLALLPIGGAAQQIATLALTTLCSRRSRRSWSATCTAT